MSVTFVQFPYCYIIYRCRGIVSHLLIAEKLKAYSVKRLVPRSMSCYFEYKPAVYINSNFNTKEIQKRGNFM